MNPETVAPMPPDFEESCKLKPQKLRWRCDSSTLNFDTTADVEPIAGVVGQDKAVNALRFGLEIDAPGQNIFVRGLHGTGRLTLVRRLLQEIQPACALADDRCYVHNFEQPDRPRLVTLPRGKGTVFQQRIDQMITFIRSDLLPALTGDTLKERRTTLEEQAERDIQSLTHPFEEKLQSEGLALASVQVGSVTAPAILPVVEGRPVPPEQFQQLVLAGNVSQEKARQLDEQIKSFTKELNELGLKVRKVQRSLRDRIHNLFETETRTLLNEIMAEIKTAIPGPEVSDFLDAILEDVVQRFPKEFEKGAEFVERYAVNLILSHNSEDGCPIIVENSPSLQNLLGTIDYEPGPQNRLFADHRSIRAGSLLRADGGYLILEARELLTEPGAWRVLVRTLKASSLEIVPPELRGPWASPYLKPEPIPIKVKVILLGGSDLYYALDAYDPDFPNLFKVLADFDTVIDQNEGSVQLYAGVLSRIAQEEGLLPFDRGAVAQLAEHGARVAAQQKRLTARFGRIADIAREASHFAKKASKNKVQEMDIVDTIKRSKERANLPTTRFRQLVADGTILIYTSAHAIGQVNGLAVVHAGPLTYGFPSRITATIGPGTAGTINIEREAQLSGAIHTKGFYILGGLLRYLLKTDHALAFDASVAFEQSYGGIDGDSASGAEMCCLLSALTNIPLRQDLAMTGAIDQFGNILPIGAANEKIEGFYDTCNDAGLTGTQGVIIPHANVEDLMLRQDVVDRCQEGAFHVYSVSTIQEALQLFTGVEAGVPDAQGKYPKNTLLGIAVQRAWHFWTLAVSPPQKPEGGGASEVVP